MDTAQVSTDLEKSARTPVKKKLTIFLVEAMMYR
jgi:hypothetical protein